MSMATVTIAGLALALSLSSASSDQASGVFSISGVYPNLVSANPMDTSLKMSEIGTGAMMPWNDNLYTLDYLRNPGAGSGAALRVVYPNMTSKVLKYHTSCYANRMIHRGTNSIVIGPYVIGSGPNADDNIQTLENMSDVRIGGMAEHILTPDTSIYLVGMEGQFWEANLVTNKVTQLFDLCKALDMCHPGEQQHFKAAFTRHGKVYVASNTFDENDFMLNTQYGNVFPGGGRLASWDGKSSNWTILETTAFAEVTGRTNFGAVTYAVGWDAASVILKVLDPEYPKSPIIKITGTPDHTVKGASCPAGTSNTLLNLSHAGIVYIDASSPEDCCAKCTASVGCATWSFQNLYAINCHLSPYKALGSSLRANCTGGTIVPNPPIAPPDDGLGKWQTYRLPKGAHSYDHLWQTEWPRIREIETERYLMDFAGLFYELSPLGWAGSSWGIRPVSQHLRMVPDYCTWRGLLVLGGNQVTPHSGANIITGQAQTNLWFGKSDDLWSFGKPKGWGGPWRNELIQNGTTSDPFLMTGFDGKTVHISMSNPNCTLDPKGSINLQVDFTGVAGSGKADENWHTYKSIPMDSYVYHVFPQGFSAHWIRVQVFFEGACSTASATVQFHYT